MPIENEITKDKILRFVVPQDKYCSEQEIASALKIDADIAVYLLRQMEQVGHVRLEKMDSCSSMAIVEPEGRGFHKLSSYEKEYEEKHLQLQKVKLEIDNLVTKIVDYPKVQWRAKWAIRLSGIAIAVSILLQVLQWIYKMQN